jgi:hypothetical protein
LRNTLQGGKAPNPRYALELPDPATMWGWDGSGWSPPPSVVQRKVLTPNDFRDLLQVERRRLDFQCRYQQTAVPFDWRFTRSNLAKLLHRLDEHRHHATAAWSPPRTSLADH